MTTLHRALASLLIASATAACSDGLPTAEQTVAPVPSPSAVEDLVTVGLADAATGTVVDGEIDGADGDATPGDGTTDTDIAELPPGSPMIAPIVVTPDPIEPAGAAVATTTVTDDVDTAADLAFEWTIDDPAWTLSGETLERVDVTAPDLPGDDALLTLTVTDTDGLSASASATLTVRGLACDPGFAHCDGDIETCFSAGSGISAECPAASCLGARVALGADATDGEYFIDDGAGGAVTRQCDMTTAGGGWTLASDFDAGRDECPTDWTKRDIGGGVMVCHRGEPGAGSYVSSSASLGTGWRQIRGRVVAYQKSSTDAFVDLDDIDGVYVDGVSLTWGTPRNHIWSFGIARFDFFDPANPRGGGPADQCPCQDGPAAPGFVGGFYTCESADDPSGWDAGEPLFRGDGFGATCDTQGDPASFERTLDTLVDQPVEIRVGANQSYANEDVGLGTVQLWTREMETESGVGGAGQSIDEDHDGLVDEIGSGPGVPGLSCRDIRDNAGFAPDGVYWIKPRSDGDALEAYCDMTRNGGGWTLGAVCRSHDRGCDGNGPQGEVLSPRSALSGKLGDNELLALLEGGERTTRGEWRQVRQANADLPESFVVFNEFADPSRWDTDGCGDAGRTFDVRSAGANGVALEALDALGNQAEAAAPMTVTTGGPCPANGWSNLGPEAQGLAAYSNNCEEGPSMSACESGTRERADLVLWLR